MRDHLGCRIYGGRGGPIVMVRPIHNNDLIGLPATTRVVFSSLGNNDGTDCTVHFTTKFPGIIVALSNVNGAGVVGSGVSCVGSFGPLGRRRARTMTTTYGVVGGRGAVPYASYGCYIRRYPGNVPVPDLFTYLGSRGICNN